jgi:hypothetical protein
MSKARKLMAVGLRAAAAREQSKGRLIHRNKRDDWQLAPRVLEDIFLSDKPVRAARFLQLSVSDLKHLRVGLVCEKAGQTWIAWNTRILTAEKNVLMGKANIYLENWYPHADILATYAILADEQKNPFCLIPFQGGVRVPENGFLQTRLAIDVSWR